MRVYHKDGAVFAGEYADEGEPSILIQVEYAVDKRGYDVSDIIAQEISALLVEIAGEYELEDV